MEGVGEGERNKYKCNRGVVERCIREGDIVVMGTCSGCDRNVCGSAQVLVGGVAGGSAGGWAGGSAGGWAGGLAGGSAGGWVA